MCLIAPLTGEVIGANVRLAANRPHGHVGGFQRGDQGGRAGRRQFAAHPRHQFEDMLVITADRQADLASARGDPAGAANDAVLIRQARRGEMPVDVMGP